MLASLFLGVYDIIQIYLLVRLNKKVTYMSWEIEIPIVVRSLINDFDEKYSDDRIIQMITVAAKYISLDLNLSVSYNVDTVNKTITPDPSSVENRDDDFISFVALRTACFLDQSTFRTQALMEGIKTRLGPAELDITGNLNGFKTLLEVGPCALYENLKQQYNIGNANILRAILGPFVGNNFDPQMIRGAGYRVIDNIAK
jgi:hypothetical protein